MTRGTVLVVDDDVAMCRMLEEALRGHGLGVLAFVDPVAALDALRRQPADVVVTDLNMRGMDGLTLCRRVLEARPEVPVLVITAFGSMEAAIGAIRAGARDFVTKPFDVDELLVTVDRLLNEAHGGDGPRAGVPGDDGRLSMDEVERRHILRVLEYTGGSKTRAARILGFDRTTLYRKLDRYGVK
jgi:DNA-binding NtrC family response regulator